MFVSLSKNGNFDIIKEEVTKFCSLLLISLLDYITLLHNFIRLFLTVLASINFVRKSDEHINKPYRKLQVDKMPIIESPVKLDYKKFLDDYFAKGHKSLKSINRHNDYSIPNNIFCLHCSAPNDYTYDNNCGRGQ